MRGLDLKKPQGRIHQHHQHLHRLVHRHLPARIPRMRQILQTRRHIEPARVGLDLLEHAVAVGGEVGGDDGGGVGGVVDGVVGGDEGGDELDGVAPGDEPRGAFEEEDEGGVEGEMEEGPEMVACWGAVGRLRGKVVVVLMMWGLRVEVEHVDEVLDIFRVWVSACS